MPSADCFLQIRHLHRGERSLETLVAHLQPGAINRLLKRLACEHAEGMRYSGLLRRLTNPARDLVNDHVVMGSVTAQQATEADDGIVFAGFSEGAGGRGNFEGAGNADKFDGVVIVYSRAMQTINCT